MSAEGKRMGWGPGQVRRVSTCPCVSEEQLYRTGGDDGDIML